VREVPHFCLDGRSVSSTRIRALLHEGNVHAAANLLGRPYRLWGHVIPGAGLARLSDLPWVSVALEPQRVVPCCGLYAAWAEVQEQQHAALVAISGQAAGEGAGNGSVLDILPLDFEGHLFGKAVALALVDRLRFDQHYEAPAELLEQLSRDIAKAWGMLGSEQSGVEAPLQGCPP
jgi:riboflavin kinase/FMN adenylyltransferase